MKFFLSYASDSDKKAAMEIQSELEKLDPAKQHKVFVDYESLKKSQDTDLVINSLLEEVDAVLYLVTVSSIRSFWCGKEVGYAQCLGKPIVPIAGPGITGEFIRSQSVPWIAGLKWVNWEEKDRAHRIVDGVTHGRGILRLLTLGELEKLSGTPAPSDATILGLQNTRPFSVSDVTISSEMRIGGQRSSTVFNSPLISSVRVEGNNWLRVLQPLSSYHAHSQIPAPTKTWLLDHLKTLPRSLEVCRVVFLVRYCIGGQHYVSSLFDCPLADVCSPDLKTALSLSAAS